MILEETLNKLLRDITNSILALPGFAIRSKQNAPRPLLSYADVDLINDSGIHWEQNTLTNRVDPDLDETIQGQRESTYSIGFYRALSLDRCRAVRTGFLRSNILSLLTAAGVGLTSRSEVRQITEPLENGWEDRAQFDVTLNYVGTDTAIVRSICAVDIDGEYQVGSQSTPILIGVS